MIHDDQAWGHLEYYIVSNNALKTILLGQYHHHHNHQQQSLVSYTALSQQGQSSQQQWMNISPRKQWSTEHCGPSSRRDNRRNVDAYEAWYEPDKKSEDYSIHLFTRTIRSPVYLRLTCRLQRWVFFVLMITRVNRVLKIYENNNRIPIIHKIGTEIHDRQFTSIDCQDVRTPEDVAYQTTRMHTSHRSPNRGRITRSWSARTSRTRWASMHILRQLRSPGYYLLIF